MMKKILIITAAVLAFAGCAKEAAQVERITVDGKEYMSFKVVVADDVVSERCFFLGRRRQGILYR